MTLAEDLAQAAREELERACSLSWREVARHTPWGDTFEGFTPNGREVCFERSYLWEDRPAGAIRVEVVVYPARNYEDGVRLTRILPRPSAPAARGGS